MNPQAQRIYIRTYRIRGRWFWLILGSLNEVVAKQASRFGVTAERTARDAAKAYVVATLDPDRFRLTTCTKRAKSFF